MINVEKSHIISATNGGTRSRYSRSIVAKARTARFCPSCEALHVEALSLTTTLHHPCTNYTRVSAPTDPVIAPPSTSHRMPHSPYTSGQSNNIPQTSYNDQPFSAPDHSTGAAHPVPPLSFEPSMDGNDRIQAPNGLRGTSTQDASVSQRPSHQDNARTSLAMTSIMSARASHIVLPVIRPNLAPFANLALLPSPRSRGLGGCPAWITNAMSHTPMLPSTNMPGTTIHPTPVACPEPAPSASPFSKGISGEYRPILPHMKNIISPPVLAAASSCLAPQEESSFNGLGKRKARGTDYCSVEDSTEPQALFPAQRAVPPIRSKKQKRGKDEAWYRSRHCDFCNQTNRLPISTRHINSDMCKQNKARYEMEFGPVPPGLRLGQGHRGSQGQPPSINNIAAVPTGLVVDSHIQQQTLPQLTEATLRLVAAYQGLGTAQNPPHIPVLVASHPAITQPASTTASDHQGPASPREVLEDGWSNERPGYSLPVFDSADSQPSSFDTGAGLSAQG